MGSETIWRGPGSCDSSPAGERFKGSVIRVCASGRQFERARRFGTLSGGINVGQGEFPPSYISGSATNAPPGSCEANAPNNVQMPYCHNVDVNIHHNYVAGNSSTGDELFSATPAGAGGVSICTGADYYKFNYN